MINRTTKEIKHWPWQGLEAISPWLSVAKTAGYYGKQGKGFDRFYLAVPARGGQSAEVRIYTVQD